LIGAGEWVFRKVGRLPATGFFGAGVACLFIISYAGHGYWPVYSRDTAFVLMALCTLIGAAVAMRARLVSVAVLSLIGGNLAPIILPAQPTTLAPFLTYLLTLELVALVLAWWGGSEKWWTLRGLSLVTTSLWMFTLMGRGLIAPWSVGMTFTLLYALLYQLEVTYSAWRRARTDAGRGAVETDRGAIAPEADVNVGAVFSLVTTAVLSVAMGTIFWREAPAVRGTWFLTFAAVATAASIILRRSARAMSISYRIQAAGLLLVAVPVILDGPAISFGWAVMALALATASALLNDRSARITAVIAWALSLFNLMLWSGAHPNLAAAPWITLFMQPIALWACVGLVLAMVGQAVAILAGWPMAKDENLNREIVSLGRALSIAASAVVSLCVLGALPPPGATVVLLAYAWLLVGADFSLARLRPLHQACAVLGLVIVKWAAIDVFSIHTTMPLFNPLMGTAFTLAGSLIAIYRLKRNALDELFNISTLGETIHFVATLIVLWAGSFEIAMLVSTGQFPGSSSWSSITLINFAWTAWWAVGLSGCLAYATRRDDFRIVASPALRTLAMIVVLLAIKFLTVDTGLSLLGSSSPMLLINAQCATGAILLAALVYIRYALPEDSRARVLISGTAVLIPLWCGTIEIHRGFDRAALLGSAFADPHLARQVAFSIFFSIYAIACVALGFRIRVAGLRYFGLALFALTLAKVGVLDLAKASTGYRFLSFMGLGGLLMVTSVLYGKLSPRLLRSSDVL
jgi:uncharacterized membrane protein